MPEEKGIFQLCEELIEAGKKLESLQPRYTSSDEPTIDNPSLLGHEDVDDESI